MNTCMVEAWVLWMRPYGEYDAVVGLYSKEFGKLKAYARGVRKLKSKLKFCLVPYSKSRFRIHKDKRNNWIKIIGGEQLVSYSSLHSQMDKIICASWICEVMDRLTPFEQPSHAKFDLIGTSLKKTDQSGDAQKIRVMFALSLLEYSGHGIAVSQCAECRCTIGSLSAVWIGFSGCICERCRFKSLRVLKIDQKTYRWLNVLKKDPFVLEKYRLNRVELESLVSVTDFILSHYLQKPLKADTFKQKVKAVMSY